MTIGKSIALIRLTFVGKLMSLFFKYAVQVCHSFSSKEEASFNFMAVVTICSDFGAQVTTILDCNTVPLGQGLAVDLSLDPGDPSYKEL